MTIAGTTLSAWESFFFCIGQISFLFGLIGFGVKRLIPLRFFLVLSQIFGLASNAFIAATSTDAFAALSMTLVSGWLALFLAFNGRALVQLIRDKMDVDLSVDHSTLFSAAFPQMSSRSVARLLSAANSSEIEAGTLLLSRGGTTNVLQLVAKGMLIESLPSGERWALQRGSMVGEISFLLTDQYGGSPGDITAENKVTLLQWTYESLNDLCKRFPELKADLNDGIARGFVAKRRLLDWSAQTSLAATQINAPLTLKQKGVHTALFPYLSENEFSVLWNAGQLRDLPVGGTFNPDEGLACLISGRMQLALDPGQTLGFPAMSLLGEFGFLAPDRANRSHNELGATEPTQILAWSAQVLEQFAVTAPRLHVHLIRSIGRDVVLKTQSDWYIRQHESSVHPIVHKARSA